MRGLTVFLYGIVCYLIGASAYFGGLGGFLANLLGPYSIDKGTEAPLLPALAMNMGLILLFGLPHSLMARRWFKQWWTTIIPPAMERSTFMLQSGLLTYVLIWQWRAMPTTIWAVDVPLLHGFIWSLFLLGWLIAFIATFLINHFELTGLQQVYAYLRGGQPSSPSYRTPFLYKIVRHPMQMGVLLAFWATPHMTIGHLIFAMGMTAYIVVGVHFEERNLVRRFGDSYREYQRRTPQLIPVPLFRERKEIEATAYRVRQNYTN